MPNAVLAASLQKTPRRISFTLKKIEKSPPLSQRLRVQVSAPIALSCVYCGTTCIVVSKTLFRCELFPVNFPISPVQPLRPRAPLFCAVLCHATSAVGLFSRAPFLPGPF